MQSPIKIIDDLLNKVTMYRLMLYYLLVLFIAAVFLSFINVLPYNWIDLISSNLFLVAICFLINQAIASIYKLKPNIESQIITGLILTLIVGPLPLMQNIPFLTLLGVIAMASKYVISYKKQHIFNPAALAVTITALTIGQGASWWIGERVMLPFIIIGGLLMVRKLGRFNLVYGFLLSFALFLTVFNFTNTDVLQIPDLLLNAFLSPPLLFFTFVMLTEPITSPADKKLRLYFGIFTGFIYVIYTTYAGNIFYSLELSLLTANLLFRIISFSEKYSFVFSGKKEIASSIWEYVFEAPKTFKFVPGQFLEWTIPHPGPDTRGQRRYFTIASSPSEENVKLSVKIPEKPSSFKKALQNLNSGDVVYATNLEGDFILQKGANTKYVFIAGGIGVTPYRSIIKYMYDKNLKYAATLFYIAHDLAEFAYDDLFKIAEEKLKLKTVYVVGENTPSGWTGEVGRLNVEMIKKHVPEFKSNIFYISGPQPMVIAYKQMLENAGVKGANIKSDYFPGYEEKHV